MGSARAFFPVAMAAFLFVCLGFLFPEITGEYKLVMAAAMKVKRFWVSLISVYPSCLSDGMAPEMFWEMLPGFLNIPSLNLQQSVA